MTKEVSEKIARGITDKIECNTVDIDDWAEFWGFTREEYEEFLDIAIKASEQEPCEDCVSRQKVLNLKKHDYKWGDIIFAFDVELLPSVTPTRPTCEDCISREAVGDMLNRMQMKKDDTWYDYYHKALKELSELPPVYPKQKEGHWIGIDEEPHEDYECDKCGYVVSTFTANGEQWFGARCKKDEHSTMPSMYAIKSLHDSCPLTTESEENE